MSFENACSLHATAREACRLSVFFLDLLDARLEASPTGLSEETRAEVRLWISESVTVLRTLMGELDPDESSSESDSSSTSS